MIVLSGGQYLAKGLKVDEIVLVKCVELGLELKDLLLWTVNLYLVVQ